MGYWTKPTGTSTSDLDRNRFGSSTISQLPEFYEIEPAIVTDIILDKSHPYFSGHTLDADRTPIDVDGKKPLPTDPDFTWMGKALVRLIYNQKRVEKEKLIWALPLETNTLEFPVLNEIVGITNYLGIYYYTRTINLSNYTNANPDFNQEISVGGFRQSPEAPIEGNRELQIGPKDTQYTTYKGPLSKMNVGGGRGWSGTLGRYFLFNERIRNLKRREGDLVIESRFGQSIRFGAYDDNRNNDKGYIDGLFEGYDDYKRKQYLNPFSGVESGGGNPMILIRNRQRPITPLGKIKNLYPKVPPVIGTEDEKNTGGIILEDINNDGSSIHITSGTTLSSFVTTCYKKMFGTGEEQDAFQPSGATKFIYPKSSFGDQIVINSDRVVISSKTNEMFHFSKKRMAFVTDDEYTVDAQNQIIFTTNNKTVINSPAIYLGEYNNTNEPILLGQTTVNWLFDLCQWLSVHTHWNFHWHPDSGGSRVVPTQTQATAQIAALRKLQNKLQSLMSRRVFVTGGGFAPGKNGGIIPSGSPPVSIIVATGDGVPGGFNGKNRS